MKKIVNLTAMAATAYWSYSTVYWKHAEISTFYLIGHFIQDLLAVGFLIFLLQYKLLWRRPIPKRIHAYIWLTLLLATAVSGVLRGGYLSDISTDYYHVGYLLRISTYESVVVYLFALLLGYVLNRLIYVKVNWRKLSLGTGIVLVMVVMFVFGYRWYEGYQSEKIFQTSEDIRLIEGNYSTMESILGDSQLKNKKLWVDLWFSSCKPCLADFEKHAHTRDSLIEHGWTILYLGRETSHPDSYARWMKVIEKYKLKGVHFYMTRNFEYNIQNLIQEQTQKYLGFPHYLVVDPTGEVVNWDASFEEINISTGNQLGHLRGVK